jgi:hypothetical protein
MQHIIQNILGQLIGMVSLASAPDETSSTEYKKDLELARAKYEYCAKLFRQESENFEYLERKAQIFSSLIAIFLGAIILNTDFLEVVKELVSSGALGIFSNLLYFLLIILSLSIFAGLAILASVVRVQYWMVEHPDNLAYSLYAPNSDLLQENDELHFLNEMGYRYTLAIEYNRKMTESKSKKLELATWCILTSIFALCLSLVLIFLAM